MRRTAVDGLRRSGTAEGAPGTFRPGTRRPPPPAADAVPGGTPRVLGRTGPSRPPAHGNPAHRRTPAPHAPAAPALPRGRVGGAVPDAAGPDRPRPSAPAGPRPFRRGPAPVRSPPVPGSRAHGPAVAVSAPPAAGARDFPVPPRRPSSLRSPRALPVITTRVSARLPLPSRRPGPRDPAARPGREVSYRSPAEPAMRR